MQRRRMNPNTFFQMQDVRLCRARGVSRFHEDSVPGLRDPGAPRDAADSALLWAWCQHIFDVFVGAWKNARTRRQTLHQLKRVDRKLLADIGYERSGLRESVDSLCAVTARQRRRPHPGVRIVPWSNTEAAV